MPIRLCGRPLSTLNVDLDFLKVDHISFCQVFHSFFWTPKTIGDPQNILNQATLLGITLILPPRKSLSFRKYVSDYMTQPKTKTESSHSAKLNLCTQNISDKTIILSTVSLPLHKANNLLNGVVPCVFQSLHIQQSMPKDCFDVLLESIFHFLATCDHGAIPNLKLSHLINVSHQYFKSTISHFWPLSRFLFFFLISTNV